MFTKFLLTVAVVALVWFGFQFAQRVRRENMRRDRVGARKPSGPVQGGDGEGVQDLVKCPACDTWRSASMGNCGRAKCPY
jgi:hypothetical protein